MTLKVHWSDHTRTFSEVSQRDINKIITYISDLQEQEGEVPVRCEVTDHLIVAGPYFVSDTETGFHIEVRN